MLNDPCKDRTAWHEEDRTEKIVTRSTGRMVLLEAADAYLPLESLDLDAPGECVTICKADDHDIYELTHDADTDAD